MATAELHGAAVGACFLDSLAYTLAVAAKRARGAAGVSWPLHQCGWMAWDADHPEEVSVTLQWK